MKQIWKKSDLKKNGPICFLGLCLIINLIVFAYVNKKGFCGFADTDMYADTLLAKKMWEQKTLFPQGWVFGNQYYVIATPALAALFYGMTHNTNTAMVLASECMTCFLLFSFAYLFFGMNTKRVHRRHKWQAVFLCCLMLLALPISPKGNLGYGSFFFLQCSYYACYLITAFVVFGDYIRSFSVDKLRCGAWGISFVLCFATGMQSVRETITAVLPVLAYEVLFLIREFLQQKKLSGRKRYLHKVRALSYAIANVAGMITIKLLDIPQQSAVANISFAGFGQIGARAQSAWKTFLVYIGVWGVSVQGVQWFYKIFSLFSAVMVILAFFILLKEIRQKESDEARIFWLSLFGLLGTAASCILFTIDLHANYLFLWYPLAVISVFIVYSRMFSKIRSFFACAACILCMGNLFCSVSMPGVLHVLRGEPSLAKDLCEWAVEQGYEYIYGDWFCAPFAAVYSGGALEAGYWWSGQIYEPLGYLNLQNIYGEAENERAIYVFTNSDEQQALSLAAEREIALTKVADFGVYRAYTASKSLMKK